MAQEIESPLVLRIRGRGEWPVASLEDASRRYCWQRDLTGAGSSTFAEGEVVGAGKTFARISYNGRVWPPVEWHPGLEPICEAQLACMKGLAA